MSNSMKRPPAKHEPKKAPDPSAAFRRLRNRANKSLQLAMIYLDDGALFSGAKNLEAAAKDFRRAAEERNKALDAGMKLGYNAAPF